MSRVISGSVVALVLVALVAAGMWTMRGRSEPREQAAAPAAQQSSTTPAAPLQTSGSAPAEPADTIEEPAAQIPAIPPPAAAWLQAPANPVRVAVELSDRLQERRITPAGGTITTTAPDGTRVTLTFPAGSLWRSEDVVMRVVAGLGDAPFAATAMAVSISPEDLPLGRSPVLQFEPGRRSAFDDKLPVAGFSVRRGAELALYPAGHYEIDRAPGRYRIAMVLTRLGTYGTTNATSEEIDAVGTREPSDLASRLEQRIALAYAGQAPAPQQASTAPGWTLIPRVHAQGGVSLFIYDLLKQLLEYYQQVVVPKFDKLPTSDCLSGATFDAIQTYLQWRASVELLLPMEQEANPELLDAHNRLVAQRETMLRERGYTTEQIAEIDRAVEQFRDQFDRMSDAIKGRILPALQGQFSALYRCCTTQRPMQYHLTAMMRILRFGEVNGYVPVDPEPMPKVMECACLVGSNQPGAKEQFTGTLSYEQNTSVEKSEQRSSRTMENSETLSFQQSSVLTFATPEGMLADSTAAGKLTRFSSTTDDHQTCVVHNEAHLELEGRDNDLELVSINVNVQQGSYTLSFPRLPLDGSGQRRAVWNVKGPGCGKFNKARDETTPVRAGIGPLVTVRTARGELDVNQPHVLKGSQVFEQLDQAYNTTRQGTLKWDLQRCKR